MSPVGKEPPLSELPVLVEKDGHVLTVTLNRPEKRNAINCECMVRLYDAWRQLDADDELRVAILTGTGHHVLRGHGSLGDRPDGAAGNADNEWIERVREEPG